MRPDSRPSTRTVVFLVFGLLAGWLLPPGSTFAGPPAPFSSTVDPVMVGSASGEPLNCGFGVGFRVVVRNAAHQPLPSRPIQVDLSDAPGMTLYADPTPGTTVDCAARTLTRISDNGGAAVFCPRLGGHANSPDVRVSAAGVVLATIPARSTDLTGADGVTNSADLNLFRSQLFAPQPAAPETDLFVDGLTNSADLNLFRRELLRGTIGGPCP